MSQNFKDKLIKAYNVDAVRRDNNESNRDVWKLSSREKFAALLVKHNKHTLLELGSGAGIDAKYFVDMGFDVLATDLSSEMVKVCKSRGVNAKVADLYMLEDLGQKFDAVYSMNVLLHVPRSDLSKVLKTISNILNPQGLFYYGVYGGFDSEEEITDNSKMGLPRFFSFLADDTLSSIVKPYFNVISFESIEFSSTRKGLKFQSLILQKP